MPENKTGPLSAADIQAIWESSVDEGYSEPLETAGEGQGFEAWTQLFAQLARASTAIDVTTQAFFISPWSGQSNAPAAGEAFATVAISFSRSGQLTRPLILAAGTIFVEEQTTDTGTDAPATVQTGRRYLLTEDVVFLAGDQGPISAIVEAEHPGYGYNNARPGSLTLIPQVGSGFNNDVATVKVTTAPASVNGSDSSAILIGDNQPDMPVPQHVGQYVKFTAGSNLGTIARTSSFGAPTLPAGSSLGLDRDFDVQVSGVSGVFRAGELLVFASPAAVARVRRFDAGPARLVFTMVNGGDPVASSTMTGTSSGATATVANVLATTPLVSEVPSGGVGGASWKVLDWASDWALSAINTDFPAGGLVGMLDELGDERAIGRAPGEPDSSYRERVREIADVVTPNAVRRALNRALPGLPWCFREVGQSTFRGLFFDGDGASPSSTPGRSRNDAFDYGCLTYTGTRTGTFAPNEPVYVENATTLAVSAEGYFGRIDSWALVSGGVGVITVIRRTGKSPASLSGFRIRGRKSGAIWTIAEEIENRADDIRSFRVLLGYEDFRAYFLVGLPELGIQDFGMAWDVGAFDASPFPNAADGFPAGDSIPYLRAQRSVDAIRAGGVGFDLYLEKGGCQDDQPTDTPVYMVDPMAMGAVGLWEEGGILDDGAGNVTGWTDTSGALHSWAQATAGNRPTLIARGAGTMKRKKGVRFDGSHWLELAAPATFPSGWTLVFLCVTHAPFVAAGNVQNTGNTAIGDSGGSASLGMEKFLGLHDVAAYISASTDEVRTNDTNGAKVGDGKPHVVALRHSSAPVVDLAADTPQFVIDGLVESSANFAWAASQFDRLGVGFANADGFVGEIYAAAAFPRALTAKELRLLFFRWQVLYF